MLFPVFGDEQRENGVEACTLGGLPYAPLPAGPEANAPYASIGRNFRFSGGILATKDRDRRLNSALI
jgi:hypothetical protein